MSPEKFSDLIEAFSPEEQKEIRKYQHFPDQTRALMAYLAVKENLKENASLFNAEIAKDERGRPFIKNWHGNISLSHSGNVALSGAAYNRIGADVQKRTAVPEAVAELIFSGEEINLYRKLSADKKVHYLFVIWTLKEAYVKLQGTGFLEYDPASITFILNERFTEVIEIRGAANRALDFYLFEPVSGYQGAVCTEGVRSKKALQTSCSIME
ncbi:4'-phosphopantetheinyl transferase superfamily protein [Bacillus sp. FJAT-42376]|uniref:4'-phosphopantetheinyl transferase family protein n=1 Tax=Bacillus sp. FJAT-42376 TaxID=2014076 RepID=UPI0013DDFFA7|nr:4'-phosphopantetheinyl transferase superfamily protein [Bacillus sp. FJAT-42376]